MITARLHGYSVSCDRCDKGGFYASHDLDKCLEHFGLTNTGQDDTVFLTCSSCRGFDNG